MNKKYNRYNCSSRVRAIIKDKLGRTITLIGTHAFEWEIIMENDNKITITKFHNRVSATKEFNKFRKS